MSGTTCLCLKTRQTTAWGENNLAVLFLWLQWAANIRSLTAHLLAVSSDSWFQINLCLLHLEPLPSPWLQSTPLSPSWPPPALAATTTTATTVQVAKLIDTGREICFGLIQNLAGEYAGLFTPPHFFSSPSLHLLPVQLSLSLSLSPPYPTPSYTDIFPFPSFPLTYIKLLADSLQRLHPVGKWQHFYWSTYQMILHLISTNKKTVFPTISSLSDIFSSVEPNDDKS